MTEHTQLQQYKSHKVVRAGRIAKFYYASTIEVVNADGGVETITPKPEFWNRFKSKDDYGYYMQYPDGFESWSPTLVFEEGYKSHEPNTATVHLSHKGWKTLHDILHEVLGEDLDDDVTHTVESFHHQLHQQGVI